MIKAVDVDKDKWKKFKKWCFDNDSTIKTEIDKFLSRY